MGAEFSALCPAPTLTPHSSEMEFSSSEGVDFEFVESSNGSHESNHRSSAGNSAPGRRLVSVMEFGKHISVVEPLPSMVSTDTKSTNASRTDNLSSSNLSLPIHATCRSTGSKIAYDKSLFIQ